MQLSTKIVNVYNTDLNKIQLNAKGGFDFSLDTRWNEK